MSLRAWRIWIPDCVSLDLHHLLLLGIFFIIIILHLTRTGSVLPYPFYIQLLIKFASVLPSIRHNDKVWHVLQVFWSVNHHVLFMRYRAAEHRVHVIQPRNLKDKCHVKWSQISDCVNDSKTRSSSRRPVFAHYAIISQRPLPNKIFHCFYYTQNRNSD